MMNELPKVVYSRDRRRRTVRHVPQRGVEAREGLGERRVGAPLPRTMKGEPAWRNARLAKGSIPEEVAKLKGPPRDEQANDLRLRKATVENQPCGSEVRASGQHVVHRSRRCGRQ